MFELKNQLVSTARAMIAAGLGRGTSGNLSVRCSGGFLVTPTGMTYESLSAADIPLVSLDGSYQGRRKPSSEWRFHRDLYAARPEAGAVLHAHSPFATSLACLRRDIPPFHYMIARFGGPTVRCSAYATYGTQALSDAALAAMQGRTACLLANHGMLLYGDDLPHALAMGVELEDLCSHYARALQIGEPVLLGPAEVAEALEKFAAYGQQDGDHRRPYGWQRSDARRR